MQNAFTYLVFFLLFNRKRKCKTNLGGNLFSILLSKTINDGISVKTW